MPFSVTINACVVTGVLVTTPMLTTLNQIIGAASTTVPFATLTMTPACGYAYTYSYKINGVLTAIKPWFSFSVTN
jgi:uncharacterized transporter YbjL